MKYIAIVDDDFEVLSILKKFLEKDDEYEIDIYAKPEAGLSTILIKDYDLVLLDVMMPDINGLDMLKDIKSKKDIKVVIMTAYSTDDTELKSESYGADGYIKKPFESLSILKEMVDKIVHNDD